MRTASKYSNLWAKHPAKRMLIVGLLLLTLLNLGITICQTGIVARNSTTPKLAQWASIGVLTVAQFSVKQGLVIIILEWWAPVQVQSRNTINHLRTYRVVKIVECTRTNKYYTSVSTANANVSAQSA